MSDWISDVCSSDLLSDDRVGAAGIFQRRGSDVLAARGDDDLLLAARDREESFGVERADVSGLEPVAVERLRGGLRVAPVLLEDVVIGRALCRYSLCQCVLR